MNIYAALNATNDADLIFSAFLNHMKTESLILAEKLEQTRQDSQL